ncbi:hypothetical protein V2O64_10065 [Verrucomicrobiaceae bacterium 227]
MNADANMLARIARVDESLLFPIEHGTEEAQRDLLQIKLRDNIVRQRVDVISSVRFTLKSLENRKQENSMPNSMPQTVCHKQYARHEWNGMPGREQYARHTKKSRRLGGGM